MGLPTYSSSEVTMSFGGADIQGWESISVTPSADAHTPRVSSDGNVSISISADNTARATISLFQESPSNYYMSFAYNAVKTGTYVPLSFAINDPSGSILGLATGVSVVKAPSVELGAEAGNRDWDLFIESWNFVVAPELVGAELAAADAAAIASGVATISGLIYA